MHNFFSLTTDVRYTVQHQTIADSMVWVICLASCLLAVTSSRLISSGVSCHGSASISASARHRPVEALITQQRPHHHNCFLNAGRLVGSKFGSSSRHYQRMTRGYGGRDGRTGVLQGSVRPRQRRTTRLDFFAPSSVRPHRHHPRRQLSIMGRRAACGGGFVKPANPTTSSDRSTETDNAKARVGTVRTNCLPPPAKKRFSWARPNRRSATTASSAAPAAAPESLNLAAKKKKDKSSTASSATTAASSSSLLSLVMMVGSRRRAASTAAVATADKPRSKTKTQPLPTTGAAFRIKLGTTKGFFTRQQRDRNDNTVDNHNNSTIIASPPSRFRAARGNPGPMRRASKASTPHRAPFRPPGVGSFLNSAWRSFLRLEGCCEASWVGKGSAHVLAGALASSHSVVAGVVVSLAVWASCARRLSGSEDDWKQVARITIEVAVLWYCHALPHGLGAGRPLRGNFGTGKAGDLLGAMWHFLGQGAFIRFVAASGRLVNLNVLEANGLLLGLSHLGNAVAGSRMRRVVGGTEVSAAAAVVAAVAAAAAAATAAATEAHTYQLRGFFSRTNGIFGEKRLLSLPFDCADTLLALQGILSATEREVVRKNGVLASAFRDFAGQPSNTLDAHSLGAVGARNLMGMGFITARVRMFGRPALSLGWTEKASNMCMVGDPICGSLLQKLLDPTCVILKGRGHLYDAYLACVGCLVVNQ